MCDKKKPFKIVEDAIASYLVSLTFVHPALIVVDENLIQCADKNHELPTLQKRALKQFKISF